jgi:hypothetical protein
MAAPVDNTMAFAMYAPMDTPMANQPALMAHQPSLVAALPAPMPPPRWQNHFTNPADAKQHLQHVLRPPTHIPLTAEAKAKAAELLYRSVIKGMVAKREKLEAEGCSLDQFQTEEEFVTLEARMVVLVVC